MIWIWLDSAYTHTCTFYVNIRSPPHLQLLPLECIWGDRLQLSIVFLALRGFLFLVFLLLTFKSDTVTDSPHTISGCVWYSPVTYLYVDMAVYDIQVVSELHCTHIHIQHVDTRAPVVRMAYPTTLAKTFWCLHSGNKSSILVGNANPEKQKWKKIYMGELSRHEVKVKRIHCEVELI